jgi:2',3'-cyclic-nucleotide 2'-phosphodiesterase (5'-nucleotidase family)
MTTSNGFSLLTELGNFASTNGGEIPAFDALSKRLFVVAGPVVEILDLSDPTTPLKISDLALDTSGLAPGFELVPNSVAVGKAGTPSAGIVAVALAVRDGFNNQQLGQVQFFNTTTGAFLGKVTVGFLPDMVVFSPDGTKVLTADEGEANEDYTIDPVGSVSIINLNAVDLSNSTVQRAGFESFNAQQAALEAAGVRIFGPNATVAQDLEPEYITFNGDGTKAWVTLQENNAIAVVDIATGTIESILPLGLKDHSLAGNGLDASDRDVDGSSDAGGKINIQNWPVFGLYQPDSIASFSVNGLTYYVTANEGDTRVRPTDDDLLAGVDEGDIFNEETRLGDSAYILDPTVFPDAATLKLNENLGRLTVTTASGDIDGDGDFDQIVVPGARSFSIWDSNGTLVYDSGDDFEQITARVLPTFFNASNDNNSFDNRSDNKGPEPEGLAIGKVGARTYAFIGLERIGGVMAYDVTVPTAPTFVQYINTRDFTADPETNVTDSGPEGLTFIAAEDSPNGKPLLVVSNEVSQTTSVFEVTPPPFTLELFHFSDQEPLNAGAGLGDITGLSAVLNALKAQDLGNDGLADNTLILSSGDAIIPGLFYEASLPAFGSRGIADIQIQNELGVQAISFGNHEFDFGTKAIADLISGAAPGEILGTDFAGANFPYLSTNLDFATDANLAPLEVAGGQAPQPNKVTSSTVIEVSGEKIGVVGATTPTLASISSPGGVGIAPSPFGSNPTEAELDALAAIIQEEVDALLAANPDMNKVVLLAHMQKLAIEEALAVRLKNVDIIVGGGSNTRLFDENDRVRVGDSNQGEYPQFFTNAGGTQTLLVNTDGSYKYLGRLVIDFDTQGNIIPESYDVEVSGAYATDAQGVTDLNAQNLVDPEIQQIVDAIETEIIATESNVFGIASVFLNGNRSGDDTDGVRTQETNLGNLTADANLALAQAIDPTVMVSIKNGGGIRASVGQTIVPPGGGEYVRTANQAVFDSEGNLVKPEGGISENDIKNSLAFNNGLSLLTVTKTELVAILEHGVAGLPSAAGQFPQVAGVKFSFDPDLAAGDRLLSAGIFDENDQLVAELLRDGEIVGDANETFRLVTLNFLADGGDNYPFPTGESANRVNLYDDLNGDGTPDGSKTGDATFAFDGTEQDALAEYLNNNFATTPFAQEDLGPAFDNRIQNLNFREDSVLPELVALLFSGTPGADIFRSGINGFTGVNSLVFTGAGDDEVDTVIGGAKTANNRLFSGSNADTLFINNGDRLNAGSGNDEIDATEALGYRASGGLGNDVFYLGQEGRAIGGDGDDQFYVGEGGGNFITGGAGADQFWLLTDDPELLAVPNTVLDFTQGTDVIGIANQGAGFGDLVLGGSTIALGDITFATLVGVDTSTLTAADFVFI